MLLSGTRYAGAPAVKVADGWTLERLTPQSRLYGSNGLRTGPDGRVYIAQVTGSQITALDVDSGELEVISPKGGDIISPDDVAFDPAGNLYATEVMEGRVSVRQPDGTTRVLRDDLPNANGITVHQGRLLVGECRVGGRLMEIDPATGSIVAVIAESVVMPNAMEVGPDGLLYYPVMGLNEIWRVSPDGGEPERVAAGGLLGVPDSVKFDSAGFIVSTQVASGMVLRIDPRTGDQAMLAQLSPGLDNLTLTGSRLFASNFTGEIREVLPGGESAAVLPGGLNWPLDLAVGASGELYIADGTFIYVLQDGALKTLAMLFSENYPGFIRGLIPVGQGELVVTTANGEVSWYRPSSGQKEDLATGLDQPYGVAASPGSGTAPGWSKAAGGVLAVVEQGTGRLLTVSCPGNGPGTVSELATGLRTPIAVIAGRNGQWLVSEAGAGRIVAVSAAATDTVVDGLDQPNGILVADGLLYVVDSGSRELLAVDLETKARTVIASGLPVGAPPGVTPKPLKGMPPFSGPQGPFSGIAAGPDGTLYVAADAEGSVLAIRKAG
jgi:sugar lactone lactonase YvrE